MHAERFDDQWTACRPRAVHLSQQRLVRPKHVAGHRLHIPWKVIFLQTWRGFFDTLCKRNKWHKTAISWMSWAQNVNLVPSRERGKEKNIWKCARNNRFWLDDLQKNSFLILSQKALSKMILFFQNLIQSFKSSFLRTYFSPFYILLLLFLPQGNKWASNKYAQYLPDFPK